MPDWDQALCAHTRQPERGFWTSESPAEREIARRACFSCPIIAACADFAVTSITIDNHRPGDTAVWGGMTAAERHRRRRQWLAGRKDPRWRAEAG